MSKDEDERSGGGRGGGVKAKVRTLGLDFQTLAFHWLGASESRHHKQLLAGDACLGDGGSC